MEIKVASHAGFCPGVRRAISMVKEELDREGPPLYSLGPLVHNSHAVEWLSKQGLHPVEELPPTGFGRVVIRSHGVGPRVFAELSSKGLQVLDATCILVRQAQEKARDFALQGYRVIVVGERNHPEVQGIVEWAGPDTLVVAGPVEAEDLPAMDRVAVVAQTTQSMENFDRVVDVLRNKSDQLAVANTICQTTRQRQNAARGLAGEVDVMLVVGSAGSANTGRLLEISRSTGTPAYLVEGANDLHPDWFDGALRVGVTAGASTPDWIIEEVVNRMWDFEEKKDEQNPSTEECSTGIGATEENENVDARPERSPSDGYEETQPTDRDASASAQGEENADTENENVGMEDMVTSYSLRRGDIINGTVVQINNGEVLVDVGGKSEGIIPLTELSHRRVEHAEDVVKVGDKIEVFVIRPENEEGHPILSRRRADRKRGWERLEEAYRDGTEIQAEAIEVVKGGLLVDVGVRGFVPASLVERGYVEDLNGYVGKTLRLKVIELDRGKNKVVLSQKAVLEEEYQKNRAETWESLAEGQVRRGIVRRLTNFGAFVDLGGVDGLLHVSEISWGRVDHPKDALKEGQELEVKVLGVDPERERVSLGLKQLQANPWDTAADDFVVGSVVEGKVLRLAPFGAFVEVVPGIEGLVHVSQLSDRRVEKPEDVVKVGDIIPVKVLAVDQLAQRMSLSLKEADPERGRKTLREDYRDDAYEETSSSGNSGNVTIGDLVGKLFEEQKSD